MPVGSLRVLITVVSVVSVAMVATLTLSLTLTAGLSSLRSIGGHYTEALLSNAHLQTSAFFRSATDVVVNLQNFTATEAWAWPSNNGTTFELMRHRVHGLLMPHLDTIQSISFYTADNARVRYVTRLQLTTALYAETLLYPSSYAEFPLQTFQERARVVQRSDHRTAPPTALYYDEVLETVPQPPIRNSTLWNNLAILTQNATRSFVYDPIAVVGTNVDPQFLISFMGGLITAPTADLRKEEADATAKRPLEEVFGGVIVTIAFDQISTFLRATKATPGTAAFAYDAEQYLVGTSESQSFFTQRTVNGPGCSSSSVTTVEVDAVILCRSSTKSYGHGPLASLGASSSSAAALQPDAPTVGRWSLGSDGSFFVASAPVGLAFPGLRVWVALLIPESDVIGDVVRAQNTSIAVVVMLVVLLAALNFVAVWWLLRPLQHIAVRMTKAANLEDDEDGTELSAMAEVRRLQEAYLNMNTELNRIRSYVPEAVLYDRNHSSSDEDAAEQKTDMPTISASTNTANHSSQNLSSPNQSTSQKVLHVVGSAAEQQDDEQQQRRPTSGAGPIPSPAGAAAPDQPSGIQSRVCTVVCANTEGTHRIADERGYAAVVDTLGQMVSVADDAIRSRQGLLTFHGDRVLGTFNSARSCPSHGRRGLEAALQLVDEGRTPVRCGVATGQCGVGSVGSARVKTFSTIGPAVTQAAILERASRKYGSRVGVLAHQRTCAEGQGLFRATCVDVLALRSRSGDLKASAVSWVRPKTDNGESDEWLYIVEGSDAGDSFESLATRALVQLADGVVERSVLAKLHAATAPPTTAEEDGSDFAKLRHGVLLVLRRVEEHLASSRTEVRGNTEVLQGGGLAIAASFAD